MKTKEIIREVSNRTGLSQTKSKLVMDVIFDVVLSFAAIDGVALYGQHRFKLYNIAPRTCRNPRTGEQMQLPGRKEIRYRKKLG